MSCIVWGRADVEADVSQNQHLAAPCVHTSEVVSASTCLNILAPVGGVLQELHVRCGQFIPFYLDSLSTVYVATSDVGVKKSVWLIRRVAVLEDGVVHKEIKVFHISERDMVADPFTKYLTLDVWHRHMHYACGIAGALPAYPRASSK